VTRLATLARLERAALATLAGCPGGATLDALIANQHSCDTIARLINRGHAIVGFRNYTKPPCTIAWLYITDAGLNRLQTSE